MVRPGLASHLHRSFLALCLLLVAQVSHAAAGTVRLYWDANSESDLAGYVLVWGTSPGVYTQSTTVSASTVTHEVTGLTDGTYYFAVRAFNGAGLHSGYSNEVMVVLSTPPPMSSPTIASVTPATGPVAGGTDVVVAGSDFASGVTVRFGATAGTVLQQSATSLTVRTPAGTAGTVAVSVTNPDGGSATRSNAFTYEAAAPPPPPPTLPTITGFSPTIGSPGGNTVVTVTGTNFQTGATVRFGGVPTTISSASATTLVVRTPAGNGAVTVSVTNPDGNVAQAGQTFMFAAVPVISGMSPVQGPTAGGTDVTLTGKDFVSGATVKFGNVTATVISLTSTTLVARAPSQIAGTVAVTVQNTNGYSGQAPQSYTYQAPAPSITGISKVSGPATGGTELTISGSNFQTGAVVRFGTATGTVTSVSFSGIVVRTPAASAGAAAVTVTNPDGQTAQAAQSFTFQGPPTVASLSTTSGPVTGGTNVTLTGTGFQNGVVVRFGSLAATVSNITTTSLVARSPAQGAGPVMITVQNPDGQTTQAAVAFTYQGPPVVTSLSVLSGPSTGGTELTIAGSNFQPGVSVRFGPSAATISTVSATSIIVRTPALSAGTAVVTVTNPDGQSTQAAQPFTYVTATSPSITSFSPAQGPTEGGTDVTITGTNFNAGVIVRFGGVAAAVTSLTPTRLVVKSPAQVKGVVTLTVLNADGFGVQVPNAFTYRGRPPSVGAMAPVVGAAAGGTEVVIEGTDFEPGLTVSVDTIPATVVSVTSTRVVVRMPAHAPAKVGLTLTNPDSQLTWLPSAFTYEDAGPAITNVLPATGPTAGGTQVTLLGSGFDGDATVLFDGAPATVVSRQAQALTVTTPAHAAGVVSVLVRNGDGATATATNAFTYEAASDTFVRYFAEGAAGWFFNTRFALANPYAEPVPVDVTFTDTRGVVTPMRVVVPGFARFTIDETNRPALGSDAFATKFEAPKAIGIERTMTWAAGGLAYGAHSDTGVTAPRTSWVLAEGATIAGFDTYYLLQNPTAQLAQVKVQYLLSTGEIIEKIHEVAANSRTNIWVNKDDPALASAQMSATITSVNNVPVVVERSMYRNSPDQLFTTGHNSAAIDAPALRWFLAEGATGGTFDEFVLIANPNASAAQLRVSYLRGGQAPIVKTYVAQPLSRLTIWVDQEAPELAAAEVSIIVEATTPTPVVVERSMWWAARPGGEWTEAHNNRGTTTTASRWIVADGESGGAGDASTYVLVANTSAQDQAVRFTLLTEAGQTTSAEAVVTANGRYTIDVAGTFPRARNARYSIMVESVTGTAPLVVERASYSSTATITWAAGTNSLAVPLP